MKTIKRKKRSYLNITKYLSLVIALSLLGSCGNNDDPDIEPEDPELPKVILDPSITHQEMNGFGGALTWYCDRITSSPNKSEIIDLIVNDLEVDIVRLKNWYYPVDYPTNKTTDAMEVSWFKQHFDATNELYSLIKSENSSIEILLSSWGPPSALKSNAKLQEGTLKKENFEFIYDEFATYWVDILDNITFNPDYLSMQNEPSYTNEGWETCEWSPHETNSLPSYEIAFDLLYEKIKDRDNLPVLIGPESANLGSSSFSAFADVLKDKDEIAMYAYHPYNFSESSTEAQIKTALSNIKNNYGNKPNIMSEYSGMSWFKTAQFINSTLLNANSSGYIYWELIWDENSEYAMIQMDGSGSYELTPFYYLIKHYSKFIDEGYKRIELTIENANLDAVAFTNAASTEIIVVILNPKTYSAEVNLEVLNNNASSVTGWESQEDNLFTEMSAISLDEEISLKGESITTFIIEL